MNINVGCGTTPTTGPGWRNFDNSPSVKLAKQPVRRALLRATGVLNKHHLDFISFCQTNAVEYANCTRLPLEDASVDVVYTSHMVEHLDRETAAAFFREALRVLRPGAVLRVAVPDMMYYAKRYAEDGDLGHFLHALHMAIPVAKGWRNRLSFLWTGPRHHQWMYDARHLCDDLRANGFATAEALPAGQTTIADPGPLNLSERSPESLYVEARKAV
jgi:SAM-dependent methyltransferase